MKKIPAFLVLLLVTILTQNVWGEVLYGSLDFDQTWGEGFLTGKVHYGVYDFSAQTDYTDLIGSLEVEDPFASIAADEYIYVYKIVNDEPLSDLAISSFSVFAKDEGKTIDETALINSFSDSPKEQSEEGVEPTSQDYYSDSSSIIWDFGDTYIQKDEHSWLLMLKSDLAPIPGDFEIKGPEAEPTISFEVPGTSNPEPATIALFGLGSLMLFRKRKSR